MSENAAEMRIQAPEKPFLEPTIKTLPHMDTILSFGKPSLDLGKYGPLFSAEDVLEQTGINLGSLEAIVKMPSQFVADPDQRAARERSDTIYCFRFDEPDSGRHARPEHFLVGGEQLDKAINGGEFPLENIVILNEPGDSQVVGRETWMPDVGYDVVRSQDARDEVNKNHNTISRRHLSISVGEQGQLVIANDPKVWNRETVITHGQVPSEHPVEDETPLDQSWPPSE
jgi:hypothetical protein